MRSCTRYRRLGWLLRRVEVLVGQPNFAAALIGPKNINGSLQPLRFGSGCSGRQVGVIQNVLGNVELQFLVTDLFDTGR